MTINFIFWLLFKSFGSFVLHRHSKTFLLIKFKGTSIIPYKKSLGILIIQIHK